MIFNNALLLVLLVLAVASGWTLGRGGLRISSAERTQLPSQYYRGFNFLLDGEEQGAVDAFTEALEVNEETLDTHIALGSVLRKRGEVDRAIRIHQSLLTRSHLTTVQLHQSHLELARDFIAAGLHDRAEQLLIDLASQSDDLRATAQRHLLEVYEAQRDWPAAVTVSEALIETASHGGQAASGQGQSAAVLRSHYFCEQAEVAAQAGDVGAARQHYLDATRDNHDALRARVGLAQLELHEGNVLAARGHIDAIVASGHRCTPDLLELLVDICQAEGDPGSLIVSLRHYYETQPTALLALALAAELDRQEGPESAEQFLRGTLTVHPSAPVATALLLGAMSEDTAGPERQVMESLSAADLGYRCSHCGFTGKSRHWHCPGCRHWDSSDYLGSVLEQAHD